MEYTIKNLAQLSGVTTRTLRYYDQIGLLCPARVSSNGYRVYCREDVDLLHQILFYRELGISLEETGKILKSPDYDRKRALAAHLSALLEKRAQIEILINNVTKTLGAMKGETAMRDEEKFEGFKRRLIDDNESAYGKEVREKYGDAAADASNAKVRGMSEAEWQRAGELSGLVNEALKEAIAQGDPSGDAAQRACDLHRQWICMFWQEGAYSKTAHLGLARMYCDDERFREYYEAIAPGAAEFLLAAMIAYCK